MTGVELARTSDGPNGTAAGVMPVVAEQHLLAANAMMSRQRDRVYQIGYGYRITGLDPGRLVAAVRELVARVPTLRVVFDEHPVVATEMRVRDRVDVVTEHPPVDDDPAAVAAFFAELSRGEVDFTAGPLFEAHLAPCGGDHLLFLSWDHTIVDAWSVALTIRWLGELYSGTGGPPPTAGDFPAFAEQESEGLRSVSDPTAFWHDQLVDGRAARLRPAAARPASGVADCVTFALAGTEFGQRCRAVSATPGAVLLGAAALTAEPDGPADSPMVLPTMFANRDPRFTESVGLFMRTAMLRVEPPGDRTLGQARR
ncbi:MAG TPA: condensation domain-containing protein, partial [Micromonospora sp.]